MQARSHTAVLAASGINSVLLVIMGVVVVLGLIAVFIGGKSWSDAKQSRRAVQS
ncbi:hypothetical protein ACIREE_26625 [Streptomyces sp. NPDC102467]|uniref:hypothetical protein n=1 Tax=Streptomyces sp. NPDC102467 TaxID=3366179 RepID=UPI00382DF29D